MTGNGPRVAGTAAKLAELFGDEAIGSLYGPEAANLYDIVNRHDPVGIKELLQAAEGTTGPVLELGCGTGRVTFAFLEQGYEMVALDLSPDMLKVLERRLTEPGNEAYAERLEVVEGDMSDFDLGRRFDLIIITGAAVWENDATQKAAMFECVQRHLTEGGRILIQIALVEGFEESDAQAFENVAVFTLADETSPLLCTLFDYLDPSVGFRCYSVLTHRVQDHAVISTKLYTGVVHPVPREVLEKDVAAAGLRVAGWTEIGSNTDVVSPLRVRVYQWLLEVTR
ncbi:class I SAM-dependent methyltransferase [Micromonospora zamorensis]|uniref:class I SAM-dependent methyltransferase n=1 Tax=Micromonospora zamorensis TaxID=709883 RepID=UPI000C4660F9|nr:class I SAM-dependent methyltransferase [Micromonospora zamorensis]